MDGKYSYKSNRNGSVVKRHRKNEKKIAKQVATIKSSAMPVLKRQGIQQQQLGKAVQNFVLLWVDPNVDEHASTYRSYLQKLRENVFLVLLFNNFRALLSKIDSIKREKIFLIVSGTVGRSILPQIHNMAQIDAIFVFCQNKDLHKVWGREWPKVQRVSTKIKHICKSLKLAMLQCDHNEISMSFIPSEMDVENNDINHLEPSFIITTLLKDIILKNDEDDVQSMETLINYCYSHGVPESQLDNFQSNYYHKNPIWWYSGGGFLHTMVNRALREMDFEMIMNIDVFIRHLHHQLQHLYKKQSKRFEQIFVVYRGQGMTPKDFEYLRNANGGLLAFNCFLSASLKKQLAIKSMTHDVAKYEENVGVIFILTIDQTKIKRKQTPFAMIDEYSAIPTDNELLFSMHTIFRISDIKQVEKNHRHWKVHLTITNDDDPQVNRVKEYLKKTVEGTGWYRMAQLLYNVGDLDRAQGLYDQLLEKTTNYFDRAFIYEMLGSIHDNRREPKAAIICYEKSLRIKRKILDKDDLDWLTTFNDIARSYHIMGDHVKALEYYEKLTEVAKNGLPSTYPDLAITYNNIARAYCDMDDYMNALKYNKKAIKIQEKILPLNHIDLADSYSNIGLVYHYMGNYAMALAYHEKALKIDEEILSPTDPNLANSLKNVAHVLENIGNYSKALEFFEKSYTIWQHSLPSTHSYMKSIEASIDSVKSKL